MSEDSPTSDLTAAEMLRLVLADVREMKNKLGALDSIESRLAALESLVDDRFKDTRPIWQAINERTERMDARLDRIDETMQMLAGRELELATMQARLASRVTALERANEGERRTN